MRKKMSKSALLDDDDDEIFGGNDGTLHKESFQLDDKNDSSYFNALNNSKQIQSQNVSKIEENKHDVSDLTGNDIGNMIPEEGQNEAGEDEGGDEEAPLIAGDKEEGDEGGSNVSWGIPDGDAEQQD